MLSQITLNAQMVSKREAGSIVHANVGFALLRMCELRICSTRTGDSALRKRPSHRHSTRERNAAILASIIVSLIANGPLVALALSCNESAVSEYVRRDSEVIFESRAKVRGGIEAPRERNVCDGVLA